jgi:acyl-CoA synthetase (AMP-forming)/AMP-acid ligase II
MLFAVTLFGGSHAFIDGFEPKAFIRAISELNGSMSLLVPTMVTMLLQSPQLRQTDTTKFTRLLYGASPMTLAILNEAMEKLPSTKFIHAYGQTELGPLATILEPEYHSVEGAESGVIRSVGRPVPSVEIEIVDENGLEVSRGVTGEIKVKGANTMLGYWKKPDETTETLKNGWVHTGDVGYMDKEGFIYVVDRLKDMIITGGENVYSAEVENIIMQFPGLLECAVVGIPSKKWGEAVHAFVVVRDGFEVKEDTIMDYCRTQISSFKCPRTIDIQTNPLPKSAAGKIQKFELRAPFWAGHDRKIS